MKNKLHFIEGIRGLAALIVIFQHLVLIFYPSLYTGEISSAHFLNPQLEHHVAISPLNIAYNGNFAVCIFFVLSGFVLSYKYFQTDNPHLLLSYTLKRYFRLLIPIAFSVVFTLIVLGIFHPNNLDLESLTGGGNWLKNLFSTKPVFFDVIYNITIDVFANGNNKYNPVLWTMGIEFLGSIMLFATLMLSHFTKKKGVVLVVMIAFLTFSGYYFYSAFFTGSLICLYFVRNSEQKKSANWTNIFLLILGIYFGSFPTAWQYLGESIYYPLQLLGINLMNFSLVLGSTLILFMASRSSFCQKMFSWKIFDFLGKISFSSYLIHLVIILAVSTNLFPKLIQSFSYPKSFLICSFVSISITFVVSWFVYKFIDQPTVRLSNKIAQKAIDYLNK